MLERLLHEIEAHLVGDLRRAGRRPPQALLRVLPISQDWRRRWFLQFDYSGTVHSRLVIDSWAARHLHCPHSLASLQSHAQTLYSRLYEDELQRRALDAVTLNFSRSIQDNPDLLTREAYERFCAQRDHIRRNHSRRRAAELHEAELRVCPPVAIDAAFQQLVVQGVNMTATEAAERQAMSAEDIRFGLAGFGAMVEQDGLSRAWLYGDWNPGSGDVGSEEARARGLRLLEEWLSAAQREQYRTHRYFDVVGSKSGKRYRIHHGRQQNIYELDGKGEQVCGWCFLPSGGLVEGDCMLAQKIALETDEEAALRVANKFPAFVGASPGQVALGGMRTLRDGDLVLVSFDDAIGEPSEISIGRCTIYQGIRVAADRDEGTTGVVRITVA